MSERREHHFTLHLQSGRIFEGDSIPEFPDSIEDVPPEEWVELGTIDPIRRRPEIDWTRVSTWRPLSERWRWR